MYNLLEYLVDSFNRLFKSNDEFSYNFMDSIVDLDNKSLDDEQDDFLSEWLSVCEWLNPA